MKKVELWLSNIFVKKTRFYMQYKRVVTRTLMNCFDKSIYFSKIYRHEWISVNETRYGGIAICDT